MRLDVETVSKDLFIGGKWRKASDGGHFAVADPGTEEVFAEVADASSSDSEDAVAAANSALPDWSNLAPRARADILLDAFDLMLIHQEDLARLVVIESGKCLKDAIAEIAYAAEFFRWYAEGGARTSGELSTSPSGTNKILVKQQAIGVSLLITPWNFPSAMVTRKIAPALAAGCTAIVKPASETPLSSLALAMILEEAGVPAGVINFIPCNNPTKLVSALLQDQRIRKLSFTGSTAVGRILLAQAAKNILSCSMELGGNAPFIVFADADIEAAIQGALTAKMRNSGQACTAANRFFVEDSIAREFGLRLSKAFQSLKLGHGLEPDVSLGPVINEKARQRISAVVDQAIEGGAVLLAGGHRVGERGYFYSPTVLLDAPHDARVVREELFGPVAPIIRFGSIDEVIALANDTDAGLASYVYTENLKKGLQVAERLEFGMVGLNRGMVSDPAAPFGGMKQSGIGREGSHDGLTAFLEKKYLAVSW